MEKSKLQPTSAAQRIMSLDVLRGLALLGILIMNVQSMSMPGAAYMNPMAYGDLTGLNKLVFLFSDLFADQKFMSIFSILFGAGIILITDRAKAKDRSSAKIHYSRNFWLLIFGLAHAYLIWYGDILYTYAMVGFLIYFLRNKSPQTLFIIAGILLIIPSSFNLMSGFSLAEAPPEALAQNETEWWLPTAETLQEEVDIYRSGWIGQMEDRVETAMEFQTFIFLVVFLWRAGGMMLIGMGLYKLGVLSAERSKDFYRKMAIWSLGIGLPITIYGLYANFQIDWAFPYSMFIGGEFNYWGSIGIALGYIALIMLACKSDGFYWLKSGLAPVGRMALTNYLMQSILCTFIFYGHGLGLFGQVERTEQFAIVLGVWIFQIILSSLWMKRYQFGPFEWLWRSLTYWKLQPFKKA